VPGPTRYFLQQLPAPVARPVLFADGAGPGAARRHRREPGAIGPFDLGSDGGASDLIRIEGRR